MPIQWTFFWTLLYVYITWQVLSIQKWTVHTPCLKTLTVLSIVKLYTRCRGKGIVGVVQKMWMEGVVQSWVLKAERNSFPAVLFGLVDSTLRNCSYSLIISVLPSFTWHTLPLKFDHPVSSPVRQYFTETVFSLFYSAYIWFI